eukprot:NODE_48_length_27236_cov_0.507573.p10 type:complete len:108 gc:universal NODE_48_length_27236_cov_0.507573:14599-14922(+)
MTVMICLIGTALGYIFTVAPQIIGKLNIGKERFYFDHLYNNVIASTILKEGKLTGQKIDKGIIEELGYKGLSRIYNSYRYNTLDSGFLPNYILYLFIGLISISALTI